MGFNSAFKGFSTVFVNNLKFYLQKKKQFICCSRTVEKRFAALLFPSPARTEELKIFTLNRKDLMLGCKVTWAWSEKVNLSIDS